MNRIPVSLLRPQAATAATIKANASFTTTCTFVEDFNMEHSDSALNVSRTAVESGAQRTATQTFNSPSCVYLG